MATTVDSEVARYYLENYGSAKKDPAMESRICALYRETGNRFPAREELRGISRQFSVDFAALFLADRLLQDEGNEKLNRAFAHYLDASTVVDADLSSYRILFVPGWDYAETGYFTGADFAKPRRLAAELGFENSLVEIPPTGGVEENAEFLATELARHRHSGKKIILAGASSAGPAIHLALGELLEEQEREHVKAWVNLGGILQGSPFIDRYQRWPRSWWLSLVAWFKGWDKQAIMSMGTSASRERFERLELDSNILVINYLGVPLSGQVSRYSRDRYPLLRKLGPNDGLTLLTDAIAPNSLTIVALGSDHFFAEDPRIDEKTVALMKLVVAYLEEGSRMEMSGKNPAGYPLRTPGARACSP